MDDGPYTPSHKKDQGTTVKAEETVKYPFAGSCAITPPVSLPSSAPSVQFHPIPTSAPPPEVSPTKCWTRYSSAAVVLVSAIFTCNCCCHIFLYLYMSVSSGLVLCHLLLLCRSSVIPLCPSHNPTWPAQTIVTLLSHTEGVHQFARNQIVIPHATTFLHNSSFMQILAETYNTNMRWKSEWKRQSGSIVGLESWWPVSEWC